MKIIWITIAVKSMKESIDFYTKLFDLKILNTITPRPGMLITFLDGEGIQLELIQNDEIHLPVIGKDISFAFDVGNLDDFLLKIKNYGIQEIEGPVKMGVNHIFAFITDPNGLKIQLSGS